MGTEEITFREFIFNILHEGQAFHLYRMTTKAKNALADHINEVHLDLLNVAEDTVRDELDTTYAEYLPVPEAEEDIEYPDPESSVTVDVGKKKSTLGEKISKMFGN